MLRVGIVGAGIVGLAHAVAAARRGHRVTVLERHAKANGASIRNFGMVWPIGQPHGELYQIAMRSRQCWLEINEAAGVWIDRCGSVHLAYRDDEWAVLAEFADAAADLGIECRLIGAADVAAQAPAANRDGLIGGLDSPTELCINPRQAIGQITSWLADRLGVEFRFSTMVTDLSPGCVQANDAQTDRSQQWDFDRVIVCGGAEVAASFPQYVDRSRMRLCKLQMLRTDNQPDAWRLGRLIAGGLTLRHYASFEICPSLKYLKQRIASEQPELDRFGIHVMASQNELGHVIIGDSHEYDDQIEPFDKEIINQLIVRELKKIICLPRWEIAERWHGTYAKHPFGPILRAEPMPEVHIRTATGGAGMTLAFGLAEADWESWSA
jgi:D-hydroxyproline dehydrogenase subunit beta